MEQRRTRFASRDGIAGTSFSDKAGVAIARGLNRFALGRGALEEGFDFLWGLGISMCDQRFWGLVQLGRDYR